MIVNNGYLYAGTFGSSVWKRPVSEIVGLQQTGTELPTTFILHQNYPNPFNPTTKIKFSLPHPSQGGAMIVSLKIYDILGREIASLIPPLWGGQEGLQPGTYEVEFDGSNYSSGVYFYHLMVLDPETGSGLYFVQTKKLLLLK